VEPDELEPDDEPVELEPDEDPVELDEPGSMHVGSPNV
jgi:hypothetical protein